MSKTKRAAIQIARVVLAFLAVMWTLSLLPVLVRVFGEPGYFADHWWRVLLAVGVVFLPAWGYTKLTELVALEASPAGPTSDQTPTPELSHVRAVRITRTRASRLGLVVTIIGTGLVMYHLYTFQPRNSQRPESPQHRELVLRLEREAAERDRKTLADVLAGRPVPECAPSDDACLLQKQLDEMGLSTSAADLWAKWTPDSYIRAWANNIAKGLNSSLSFQIAVVLVGLGLYLLLLHEVTLGRLISWVQNGT